MSDRACPSCGEAMPSYRITCKACGHAIGRDGSEKAPEEQIAEVKAEAEANQERSAELVASLKGSWQNVPLSGIIAGVIGAFAFSNLPPAGGWIVSGLAYSFCILNPNFKYNWIQYGVATAIMVFIIREWQWMIDVTRSLLETTS